MTPPPGLLGKAYLPAFAVLANFLGAIVIATAVWHLAGLLQSLGAIAVLLAIFWYGFDHYASGISYLLFSGLVLLLVGWSFS